MTTDQTIASVTLLMRRAARADVADIVRLLIGGDISGANVDSLDDDVMPVYLAAFDAIDRDFSQQLFVVERGETIVGTIQITYSQTLVNRARLRATLESVHVAASERGKGVGAAMVMQAVAIARGRGAGVIQLTSNKKRVDAHRFYERLGFQRSHEGFKLEF